MKKFVCLSDCGYCCTEGPELFISDKMYEDKYIEKINGKTNIKTKKKCIFNNDEKKCVIYENRPMHCRLYPLRIFISDNVDYTVDFSCPGTNFENEEDLLDENSKNILVIKNEINQKHEEYKHDFLSIYTKYNIDKIKMKNEAESNALDLIKNINRKGLNELIYNNSIDLFSSLTDEDSFFIYDYKSNISFQLKNTDLHIYGKGSKILHLDSITGKSLTDQAMCILNEYVNILNKREMSTGIAMHIWMMNKYKERLEEVYKKVIEVSVLDTLSIAYVLTSLENSSDIDVLQLWNAIRIHERVYFTKKFIGYLL
ncbi:MAG: YkgJ family cysteine cluster protein [Thermoplasmata archaeon]